MYVKRGAFTLIELMIVVAIVAFLATIAVPQYFKYLAKAKQTEVLVNLASLHTAQQAYFAQNGRYTNVLWGNDGIGWRPEGYKPGRPSSEQKNYYSYGFYSSEAKEGIHYFVGKLNVSLDKLIGSFAEEGRFMAKAAGDIAGKGNIDVWSVDHERSITNIEKGIE